MRVQLSEMRRQSAQQAFQALRALHVQLGEEILIVKEIQLNAKYCVIFENDLSANLGDPGYSITHEKHFGERFDKLEALEQTLSAEAARSWGSIDAQISRSGLLASMIELRRSVLMAKQKLHLIVGNFRGPYVVADWHKAASGLSNITVKVPADEVYRRCEELISQLTKEQEVIGPTLRDATKTAFGWS